MGGQQPWELNSDPVNSEKRLKDGCSLPYDLCCVTQAVWNLGLLYHLPYNHRNKSPSLGQMFSQQTGTGFLAGLLALKPSDTREKHQGAQLSSPLSSSFGSRSKL